MRFQPRALVLTTVVFAGCGRLQSCRGRAPLAELSSHRGTTEYTRAGPEQWLPAPDGQAFLLGDAVRTGAGATARVRLRRGGGFVLGPSALVRFLLRPQRGSSAEAPSLRLEAGEAELETGDQALVLETRRGIASLRGNSRLRVTSDATGAHIEVVVGQVAFEQADGRTLTANAGQRVSLAISGIEFETLPTETPDAAPPRPVARPESSVVDVADVQEAPDVELVDAQEPPDEAPEPVLRAMFRIRAGESSTLHSTVFPVNVGIEPATRCTGELGFFGGRRGGGILPIPGGVLAVSPGNWNYELRCNELITTRGTLRFLRDAGTGLLPRTATQSPVDVDGRNYSLLYQNLPPAVLFRWRASGGPFVLRVRDASNAEVTRRETSSNSVQLPSGTLQEGQYRITLEGPGVEIPETQLRIAYDNAAPAAQLYEPTDPITTEGELRVQGVALLGSSVRVGETTVETDSSGRFRTTALAPAVGTPLVFRIAHPSHGVHYYFRHRVR